MFKKHLPKIIRKKQAQRLGSLPLKIRKKE